MMILATNPIPYYDPEYKFHNEYLRAYSNGQERPENTLAHEN